MKLIIAGSRTVRMTVAEIDAALLYAADKIDPIFGNDDLPSWFVICGGANGADASGKAWAHAKGVAVLDRPVTTEEYARFKGYLAPKMRNRRMADEGDAALVFWDGESGGSSDMVCRMVARRKPVHVVPWRRFKRT